MNIWELFKELMKDGGWEDALTVLAGFFAVVGMGAWMVILCK